MIRKIFTSGNIKKPNVETRSESGFLVRSHINSCQGLLLFYSIPSIYMVPIQLALAKHTNRNHTRPPLIFLPQNYPTLYWLNSVAQPFPWYVNSVKTALIRIYRNIISPLRLLSALSNKSSRQGKHFKTPFVLIFLTLIYARQDGSPTFSVQYGVKAKRF